MWLLVVHVSTVSWLHVIRVNIVVCLICFDVRVSIVVWLICFVVRVSIATTLFFSASIVTRVLVFRVNILLWFFGYFHVRVVIQLSIIHIIFIIDRQTYC